VVLSDFAALTAPPSSSWGTSTWATDHAGAAQLLKDLGLHEEFLDGRGDRRRARGARAVGVNLALRENPPLVATLKGSGILSPG
jgi:hypothetical protein